MSELKNCPFCGNEPRKTANHTILCETCHRETLPDAWNTRPIEDKYRKALEDINERHWEDNFPMWIHELINEALK